MNWTIPQVLPNWINGQAVCSEQKFANFNPFSQERICDVSIPSKDQINQCIESATEAQKSWKKISPKERAKVLMKASQLLRKSNNDLARLESIDTGRVINETSVVDIISGADCLDYFAALIQTHSTRFVELENDSFAYTLNPPLGVCLGIGAWNYPLQIACWKAAPALAAGNAVIFKPSELTPLTAFFLGSIFKEAGLPDGLFSVLHGDHHVGSCLVDDARIKKVSLTGSTATGKKIYEASAKHMRKVSFELGGKSPLIIFEDSDLDSAVHATMAANFYSQGEICSNGTRVFVQESISQEFTKQLLKKTQNLTLGNPLDTKSQVGPLISIQQKEQVLRYIQMAEEQGAKRLTAHPDQEDLFVLPTILSHCTDEMTHCQEEIFGPVASLLTFTNEDEVIERANQTEFGLAGGVFTQDIQKAHRVARSLEVGICWINNYNITPIEVPFGGAKNSGLGSENGIEALKEYTRTQTIYSEGNSVNIPL